MQGQPCPLFYRYLISCRWILCPSQKLKMVKKQQIPSREIKLRPDSPGEVHFMSQLLETEMADEGRGANPGNGTGQKLHAMSSGGL